MITIAHSHYEKMLELIKSLNKNMLLLNPSSEELKGLMVQWSTINSELSELYAKLEKNLQQILQRNNELQNQNSELSNRLQNERSQNNSLIQTITMQRSELAKNQTQLTKYKEAVKKHKQSHIRQIIKKDELIADLQRKVKKYKKIKQDQEKKFEKLDKKINQITEKEIAQRSSMKQQELDQELLELENICKDLDEDLQEPEQFEIGSDTEN